MRQIRYALLYKKQMDLEVKPCRSLPPLVEGKVHGNLKLVIDEIIWIRRNPGDVTVVASWWGEQDSAQFRPIDGIENTVRTSSDTTEIYDIRTNVTLFEDYIKNCEAIELVIIAEKIHEVIGTVHVGELSRIFTCEPYSEFFPIVNNSGSKIGKIHVFLQLIYLTKLSNMQSKPYKCSKKHDNDILLSAVNDLQYNKNTSVTSCKNMENIKKRNSVKSANVDTFDTYRSVLKTRQPEIPVYRKKFNEMVTDKLVAQIVARAQRLRGAILRETCNEDSLALSDTSMNNEPDALVENDTKLYEYILGKKMTSSEEKKALDILRSISPPPSLIDLASETIKTDKDDNKQTEQTEHFSLKLNNPVEDALCKETYTEPNETHPLDYIDSIRIFIESFTMSPAGYRRAKSTCLQHDVPLTLTYFIQYDTTFRSVKQTDTKSKKDNKFVRTCAKKQTGRVIDFNSEGVYSISRHIVNKSFPLKFKLFVRHINQKFPTELGCGSMNISDIVTSANLSSTQCIAILNKGIKIGELNVTAELGCNPMNFGKQFVDAVLSAKENIPILKTKPLETASANGNRYRSATGTHSSKSNNKVSSVSAKRIECFANNNSNKDLISKENIMRHREQNLDNKKIDTSNPESSTKDKVLLHGLIYVGEGKDLPESNTYLICRAFWREDKATSQICNNTKHPFYHFFQLVPLIHGTELLERIRDNHIIIEVYSRQNSGTDNLLGIAKLSVHQLYIAYRDPLVLPHLLLSKYPVISVDGWVNINDPISGKFCGELFALVALGTAEQIASLEMSRGLRNTSIVSRTLCSHQCHVSDNMKYEMTRHQQNSQPNVSETANLNSGPSTCDNFAYHGYNTPDRDLGFADHKTQESQTDISSLKNAATDSPVEEEAAHTKHLALHTLVDRLANVLHINKSNTDQSAQTEISRDDQTDVVGATEELRLNILNSNSNSNLNDDSNSCSPGNNFHPTEMYRSVGVGAEYEESNQQQNDNGYHNLSQSSITEENTEKEESNTNCDGSFFRSVVEIECALHLPKIEGPNELLEPSTYVTFQDLSHKRDHSDQSNSYVTTNVFRHSCNPKWNWRCDAKLSTDLLLNNQKRLILKVWHLNDPDASAEINLEKDTIIGFSAIDLSVLMAGFPMVSGWFHIMDLTGKCNGQIKISITPLDSLLPLRKLASVAANNLSKCGNLSQTIRPYQASYGNAEPNSVHQMVSYVSHNKDRFVQNDHKPNDFVADIGHGLEDISMSFLSSSLKQKLTELDQITKRLQSRLRDVTSTAFEDDIYNDFDMIELNSDNENTEDRNENTDDRNEKNDENSIPQRAVSANETSQVAQQCKTQIARNTVNSEKQVTCASTTNPHLEPSSNQCKAVSSEATDPKYCSNAHFGQHSGYYHNQYKNQYSSTRDYLSYSNSAEYPVRGTKTHINHLLDKLSLDLPPRLTPEIDVPMKKDILQLFAALREHKNSSQVQNKSVHTVSTSVPAQINNNTNERHVYSHATNSAASDISENTPKSSEESRQPSSRISTVIREELVAEENNDSVNCDELTTYLLTSNIRHLDLDNIINPLLYQHLIPDLQVSSVASPEVEAVKQLDNRYSRSFNAAIQCGTKIDRSTRDDDASSRVDAQTNGRTNVSEEGNTELFSSTSSSASENANESIDITVIYKSTNELMLSNNAGSSSSNELFDKLLIQQMNENGKMENCSAISELSFPGVSRQAPEGGNPVEEIKKPVVSKQHDTQDDTS